MHQPMSDRMNSVDLRKNASSNMVSHMKNTNQNIECVLLELLEPGRRPVH